MKDESEALIEMQERVNFVNSKFMEKIDEVEVFFEDCENCSARDECPNCGKLGAEGKLLKDIHEYFDETGIRSRLHPMTSKDNEELERIVCEKGGIVPVKTRLTEAGPICAPEHNFLLVKTEDGKQLLYTVDLSDLMREKEEYTMIYR